MCERCNALDGRRTKAYKIEKGEAVVSRDLCDDCARLTNQTYPVRGVPAAPKPEETPAEERSQAEAEAAVPEAPAVEGEEASEGEPPAEPEPEAEQPRSPRKRARG
jgi:hypothetical protein